MKDFRETEFTVKSTDNSPTCQAETLESLKGSSTKILDKILILFNKHGIVFANQTTLGKSASVGRRQANRLIKQLAEAGIIYKKYRSNLTSIYYPAPFLLDPKIRQRFSKKFEAFRWLPLILLFSGLFIENVSRTITANLFIKTITITNTINGSQKRRRMGFYNDEAQAKQIELLTDQLGLSRVGQIKLKPFPADCLAYAFDKLQYANNVKSSFHWLLKLCNEWCVREEKKADWQIQFQLAREENISLEGSVLSGEVPRLQQKKQDSFKKSSWEKTGYQKRETQRSSTQRIPTKEYDSQKAEEERIASKIATDERHQRKVDKFLVENGREEAIRQHKICDYNNPQQNYQAGMLARLWDDKTKEELSADILAHPENYYSSVVNMIKDFKSGKLDPMPVSPLEEKLKAAITPKEILMKAGIVEKARMNPFADVLFSGQIRVDEPPMTDYGVLEELFETE